MISFERRQRAQAASACIGVDAGKFSHTLVIRQRGQRDSRPYVVKTTRASFDDAVAFIRALTGDAPAASILIGIEFAGNYGFTFAYYLAQRGYQVVSVLPAHTKRWKEVAHNQPLKTDAKDAGTITDLVAQGHFVAFPFLKPEYAQLRYLAAGRERLSLLRRGTITLLRTMLQVVFPEFESLFPKTGSKTALAVLRAYPTPQDLLAAPRQQVIALLRQTSRGQFHVAKYEQLRAAARATLGLPGAQASLREEIRLTLHRLAMYQQQIAALEASLVHALARVPEARPLLSIPRMGPVTAGTFLGAIGDPQAYESGEQVLRVAGLSLVERSSGILHGAKRLSKRGRPLLRRAAYMFTVRNIAKTGFLRPEYEALLARNGGTSMKAIAAVMRSALRIMYSIARDRRRFTFTPPVRTRPTGVRGTFNAR